MSQIKERLSEVEPARRVLLLAQCLRPSQTCPGKFSRQGLECPGDCRHDCVVRRLRDAALHLGYGGVCVAAGGAMALRFVKEYSPAGIVAVACDKELSEGVEGVKELAAGEEEPAIVVVPLLRDGCVDTEVDEEQVFRTIALGCATEPVARR